MKIFNFTVMLLALSMISSSCGGGGGGGGGGGDSASTGSSIPTAPSILIAYEVSDGQINISWAAATDDVGVTGYNIYREGDSSPFASTTATTLHVTGLDAATEYCYQIRALDADGNESGLSMISCATTLVRSVISGVPTVPAGLSADPLSDVEIKLTWTASTHDAGVVRYYIYRNGFPFPFKVTTATTTSDTGLNPSTTYSYQVSAVDEDDNESVLSEVVSATTLPAVVIPADTVSPTFLLGEPDDVNKTVCIFFDDKTVFASFSEPVLSSSVDASTFTVTERISGTAVTGSFDYTDPKMPEFIPDPGKLEVGKTYDVTLTAGITDLADNPLANPSAWSFTIDEPTVPCLPGEIFNNDPATECRCF